jgi:hypothetical protein
MALSVNFTLAATSEVASYLINRITFIEEDLSDATTTLLGIESGEQTTRMRVVGAPATVAAAVATAAGTTVTGQTYAPFVLCTQTGDGARVWFQYATVAVVLDDATTGAQCYVETSGPDGRWRVVSTRAALLASLVAAAAATPSTGASRQRLLLQAFVNGVTGALLGTITDFGLTLTATSPFVPGSGFWLWTLGGTNVPSAYIVNAQGYSGQVSNYQCAQLGAGSPNFFTTAIAIDRLLGTGQVSSGGVVSANWGATVARAGAGLYDVTLNAPGPVGGDFTLFAIVSGGAAADLAVGISYTSATVARVTFTTQAGVATDSPFSFFAMGGDDSGSNGYQPTAPAVYTLQVFSAVA